VTELNGLGCFLGTPIVGDPVKPKKLTRSQKNYQDYLSADVCDSFAEWMGMDKESVARRQRNRYVF